MRIKQVLTSIILASITAGAIAFIASSQKFPQYSTLHQMMLGLAGVMITLSVGAGVLFLLGRKDFKAGPRKAYTLLCLGIVLFGVSQIQFPLIDYFELRHLLGTAPGGLVGLPYLLSVLFTLGGMRILTRSLNITTKWASLPWIFGTAFIVALLSTFLPYADFSPEDLKVVKMNGAFAIWIAVLYLFAARLAWRARREVGPLYKGAMVWLFAGLAMVSFGAVHIHVATRIFHGTWYEQDSVATIPLCAASALFVAAGYATLAIKRRLEEIPSAASRSGNVFLDVVMYAAHLVSTPRDIDPTLDTVRQITAIGSGGNFTPAQEQQLCQTYRTIEDYLVTREPLRPFDATQLREHIARSFALPADVQSKLWGETQSSNATQLPKEDAPKEH